ncbi:hypothetical protein D3C86_2238980 [compost metagenome]
MRGVQLGNLALQQVQAFGRDVVGLATDLAFYRQVSLFTSNIFIDESTAHGSSPLCGV